MSLIRNVRYDVSSAKEEIRLFDLNAAICFTLFAAMNGQAVFGTRMKEQLSDAHRVEDEQWPWLLEITLTFRTRIRMAPATRSENNFAN